MSQSDGKLGDFADEYGTTDDAGDSMRYDGTEAKKQQYERLRDTGDHLRLEKPSSGVKDSADPENSEIWCNPPKGAGEGCENRITVGPDGDEYGHEKTCEHSVWRPHQ